MAYTTGECTGHLELLEIVRDFVTDAGELGSQAWAQIGGQSGAVSAGDFVSLRGPGLGGTDQVLVSFDVDSNVPAAHYMLGVRGHTAYNTSNPSPDPPGLSSPWTYLPLIAGTIRYWIVANGRRIIIVAKSNNRYNVAYAGFILPEHLPSDWQYPLLAGASSTAHRANSDDSSQHQNFWRSPSSGYLFTPEQQWRPIENLSTSGSNNDGSELSPDSGRLMAVDWKNNIGERNLARTIDGQPWLVRGRLAQYSTSTTQASNFLGHFDGVFFTPSAGATIEGIIEHGGKGYLVVANIYRNSVGQVAAVCLE